MSHLGLDLLSIVKPDFTINMLRVTTLGQYYEIISGIKQNSAIAALAMLASVQWHQHCIGYWSSIPGNDVTVELLEIELSLL